MGDKGVLGDGTGQSLPVPTLAAVGMAGDATTSAGGVQSTSNSNSDGNNSGLSVLASRGVVTVGCGSWHTVVVAGASFLGQVGALFREQKRVLPAIYSLDACADDSSGWTNAQQAPR